MLIYFQVALLLLSSAPSYVVQIVRMYNPLKIMQGYGEYVGIITILALFNMILFGLPSIPTFSLLSSSIALGSGVLYYLLERTRSSVASRNTIRLAVKSDQARWWRHTMGIALIWVAIVEECIFRWYLLQITVEHKFLPLFLAVVLSSMAFGLIHQTFGLETVISRVLFGFMLALVVFFSGDLLFAILSHVTYNILIHLWPMRYTVIRYEKLQNENKNQSSYEYK